MEEDERINDSCMCYLKQLIGVYFGSDRGLDLMEPKVRYTVEYCTPNKACADSLAALYYIHTYMEYCSLLNYIYCKINLIQTSFWLLPSHSFAHRLLL